MKSSLSALQPYLKKTEKIELNSKGIPAHFIPHYSAGMRANIDFLKNPDWRKYYFSSHHRDETFKARWLAVTGSWDNKVVIDIGCGPGNVYATVGGAPKVLIGVDISVEALLFSKTLGYSPLLADAHNLPIRSACADIVMMSATLHHCDDMERVLSEGARLVKPGGVLLTDQDPQQSAWAFKGLGLWLRQVRFPLYRLMRSPYFLPQDHRILRLATEIHNQKPGDGLCSKVFSRVLAPMGFEYSLYPHNHDLGAEVIQGHFGKGSWRYRLSQTLSNIDASSAEAAQSIMCVAKRTRF